MKSSAFLLSILSVLSFVTSIAVVAVLVWKFRSTATTTRQPTTAGQTTHATTAGQTTHATTAGQTTTTRQPTTTASTTESFPFAGANLFVFPNTTASQHRSDCGGRIGTMMADIPMAMWIGDWTNVADVGNMARQAQAGGKMPVFVLYNIPSRDCGSYSTGGATLAQYPGWVENVARQIGDVKSAVVIEPDAIPSLVSPGHCENFPDAAKRPQLIAQAITTLRNFAPNCSIYIDAGNANWGIDPTLLGRTLVECGINQANGFSLNVSNFETTERNRAYGEQIVQAIGGSPLKHFVIDTSRSGAGCNPYTWCNCPNAKQGELPQGFSGNNGNVDAYLWIKDSASSDGQCDADNVPAGQYSPRMACSLVS